MTTSRDDIIKLAREHEAGVSHYSTGTKPGAYIEFHEDELEAFFHAAQKLAFYEAIQVAQPEDSYQDEWFKAKADSVNRIKAIRNRSK